MSKITTENAFLLSFSNNSLRMAHLVCFSLTLMELHEQNLMIMFSSMI